MSNAKTLYETLLRATEATGMNINEIREASGLTTGQFTHAIRALEKAIGQKLTRTGSSRGSIGFRYALPEGAVVDWSKLSPRKKPEPTEAEDAPRNLSAEELERAILRHVGTKTDQHRNPKRFTAPQFAQALGQPIDFVRTALGALVTRQALEVHRVNEVKVYNLPRSSLPSVAAPRRLNIMAGTYTGPAWPALRPGANDHMGCYSRGV